MSIENQKFEDWRKEQIASLIRMGYPDAAKAFRDLGSVQWSGWQAAWQASREAVVIELPERDGVNMYGIDVFEKNDLIAVIEAAGVKCEVKS